MTFTPGMEDSITRPPSRLVLFSLVTLSLFLWVHRFPHTRYNELQIEHVN